MAKVITFAQHFPAGHPRAGQPTFFVQKLYNSFGIDYRNTNLLTAKLGFNNMHNIETGKITLHELNEFAKKIAQQPIPDNHPQTKLHTIRKGVWWKQGDFASLRVWSGVPYRSPQINLFAYDMKLQQVYNMEKIGSQWYWMPNNPIKASTDLIQVAKNDGLLQPDFNAWFREPFFAGQVLCFHKVDY